MRASINISLAIVAVLLVIVILLGDDDTQTDDKTPLTSIARASVTRIEFTRTELPDVVLVKQDQQWTLTLPRTQMAANAFAVESLLDLLNAQVVRSYAAAELDLQKFSLAPAKASVSFDGRMIELGDTESLHENSYALYDQRVYIIADHFASLLSKPLENFIDTHLLAGSPAIAQIQLPEFSLSKQDGSWRISGISAQHSQDDFNAFIEQWRYAQALNCALIQEAESIANLRMIKVFIESQPQAVEFYIADNNTLVRNDIGVKYSMSPGSLDRLLLLPTTQQDTVPLSSADQIDNSP